MKDKIYGILATSFVYLLLFGLVSAITTIVKSHGFDFIEIYILYVALSTVAYIIVILMQIAGYDPWNNL